MNLSPVAAVLFINIKIFEGCFELGDFNLNVATGFEGEGLTFGELDDEFFDESGHVVVGDYFTFPLVDREDLSRNLDLHVFFDLDLAGEAPVLTLLLAIDVAFLGGENFATTALDLAFADAAGAAATTG